MHIMEGFLPVTHAGVWTIVGALFVTSSLRETRKDLQYDRSVLLKLGAAAGFCFLLSSLKLPSVTGSCSHPTGIGFGTILLGTSAMPLVGLVVLLFQAVLLAHGGITTLGANLVSMAVVGSLVTAGSVLVMKRFHLPQTFTIVTAVALGNLLTYVCTATQLALAFPDSEFGFLGAFSKFLLVFAPTQLPLAVMEGFVTVVALRALGRLNHLESTLREEK